MQITEQTQRPFNQLYRNTPVLILFHITCLPSIPHDGQISFKFGFYQKRNQKAYINFRFVLKLKYVYLIICCLYQNNFNTTNTFSST